MIELGANVTLKDWNGRKTGDWGFIIDYDGEYYWIAFCGDMNDIKPYKRNEFTISRTTPTHIINNRLKMLQNR